MDPFSSLANSLEALKLRLATASSPEERKQVYEDALQDAHRLVDDLQQRLGGLGAEFQHSPAPEDKLKDTVHALEGTNTSSKVEGSVVQPCDSTAVEKSPERVELPLFNDVKCANISTESHQSITDKVCGACRLVTYCSEACQKSHWTQHKKDCKSPIRKADWKPSWIIEKRSPVFVDQASNYPSHGWHEAHQFGRGMHLWGNMPANDILNLKCNEVNVDSQDLAMAFIASGDLRNLAVTVNTLSLSFNKKLTLVINDLNPFVSMRNLVLFAILAQVPNIEDAAELALHFWGSIAFTTEMHFKLVGVVKGLLGSLKPRGRDNAVQGTLSFGDRSTLYIEITTEALLLLVQLVEPGAVSLAKTSHDYQRVMTAPGRVDYRDRCFAKFQPSHRLSAVKYRRDGLVVPFGADTTKFVEPNRSLFDDSGMWLQNDSAMPLNSWNIDDVFSSAAARKAPTGDLYGALHFFLRDTFTAFAQRLRSFEVSLHLFNSDALALSKSLPSSPGIKSDLKFDRIEVSNVIDLEYLLGVRKVLESWGSKLSTTNRHATLIGYSMDWAVTQARGKLTSTDQATMSKAMQRAMAAGRIEKPDSMQYYDPKVLFVSDASEPFHETSKAWREYLAKHQIELAAKQTGLKLKKKHTIMPSRLLAPLDGSMESLPAFPSDETWYRWVKLSDVCFTERFLEFSRA